MKGEYYLKSMNDDDELDLPSLTNITTTGNSTHIHNRTVILDWKVRSFQLSITLLRLLSPRHSKLKKRELSIWSILILSHI